MSRVRTEAASMSLAVVLAGAVAAQPVDPSAGPVALGAGPSVPIEGPVGITHPRPAWMKDGIVIAATNSPLSARRQQIKAVWTQLGFGLSDAEARAAYQREHSVETADQLERWGVTLAFLSLYSGMDAFEKEKANWPEIKRFAEEVHARGIRVAVYIQQGRLSREFLEARPEGFAWLAWPSPSGNYTTPPPSATEDEGYCVYRNHPGYQALMREVIDYAIKEVKADLLHFDNWVYTSGWNPAAIEDFRTYLRARYNAAELEEHFGGQGLEDVANRAFAGRSPEIQEWNLFQGWALAEAYRKLSDYARSLDPDVATEVNASGLGFGGYRRPIDLSLLVPQGDAFWDEQGASGWDAEKNTLRTNVRSYKLARLFQQSAFVYTPARLANSESMAFNYNCMGCLYSFLYGRLNWAGAVNAPADPQILPETRFFRTHRDLFQTGRTLADVAVFRGRDVNVNGPQEAVENTALFEQALIAHHIPFEIIFDQHLDHLDKYRAVVAADVRLMRDEHIEKLLKYAEAGGGLVITNQTALMDAWARPRPDGLQRFFKGLISYNEKIFEERGKGRVILTQVVRPEHFERGCFPANGSELIDAVVTVMGEPTVRVDAPPYVGTEYVRQDGRIVVHLLDYSEAMDADTPVHIRCGARLGRIREARRFEPRGREIALPIQVDDEGTRITTSGLDVYAVVVADLE